MKGLIFLFISLLFLIPFEINAQNNPDVIEQQRKLAVDITNNIEKITDKLFVIIPNGTAGNVAVYLGEDGVIIVDNQWAETVESIEMLISGITDLPIKYVFNTHYHYDHLDGNMIFGERNVPFIAHRNVRERLSQSQVLSFLNYTQKAYPFIAYPTITYEDTITIFEGEGIIKAYHVKYAHTNSDSFIFFKDENVVHTGDVFVRYGFPFIDGDNGGNIYGMIDAIDILIKQINDSTIVIPGHGPVSSKIDLVNYKKMLVTVENKIKQEFRVIYQKDEIENLDLLEGFNYLTDHYFNVEQIYRMIIEEMNGENMLDK